jgi:hypothetical protein
VRKRLFILFLAALVGLLPLVGVSAQDELTLDVRAGFDGYYKPESWVPVYAIVANTGPDIDGEIRAAPPWGEDGVAYTQPALLPAQSRKQFTLYVQAQYNTPEMIVRLSQGNKTLASETARIQALDRDFLYGVVSSDPAALSYLAGLPPRNQRRVHVAHLVPQDLPTQTNVLTSLDVLILHNLDASTLSDAQREALRGWVGLGGHLVVCGGPNAMLTAAGLDDLLPVEIRGTETTTSVSGLGQYAGSPFIASVPAVVAQVSGVAPDAQILAGSPDRPLLVRRNLDQGRIDYLALDPDLEPMRTWIGNDNLWPKMTFSVPLSERAGLGLGWNYMLGATSNIPSLDVPSVFLVIGFLFFYVVIVGPLNLLVLKLLDKRSLAWITVPVLVLAFSCLAYLVGFVSRGRRAIVSQAAILRVQLNSQTAIVDSYTGIYSPIRRAYDVRLPDSVLVHHPTRSYSPMGSSAGGDLTVEQGPPTILRQVEVDVGAMRSFAMNAVQPWSGIEAELVLTPAAGGATHYEGTITNKGASPIEDCVLLYHSQPVHIPDLAPGETVPISVNFASASGLPAYRLVDDILGSTPLGRREKRERDRKSDILNSTLQGASGPFRPGFDVPTLVGWVSESPLPVDVMGRPSITHATTLLLVPLPVSLAGATTTVLPRRSMEWRHASSGPVVSPYELHGGSGDEEFIFQLPDGIESGTVEKLFLHTEALFPPPYGTPPTIWVRNVESGQWKQLGGLDWGANALFTPGQYIDGDGGIEIKVDTDTIKAPLSVDLSATIYSK